MLTPNPDPPVTDYTNFGRVWFTGEPNFFYV
jgi:hypothetical protein